MVGIYLRYLPEELGAQARDLVPDADLETLYTAAKFAAATEDRHTTHPLLRDTQGLPLSSGDAAGLLAISGESDGSSLLPPGSCGLPPRTSLTSQSSAWRGTLRGWYWAACFRPTT